jgi:hypothetical protein
MLFPSKHDHPDRTVIAISSSMIKHLSRHRVVTYDNLLKHCRKQDLSVDYLFTPAISLLYVLGLIEYLPKADSFEWVGNSAA